VEQFDRITTNVARLNGEPCIRDLRLTVRRVLEALATYPDRAELKREYPELEDEDIRQALVFAAALVDEFQMQYGFSSISFFVSLVVGILIILVGLNQMVGGRPIGRTCEADVVMTSPTGFFASRCQESRLPSLRAAHVFLAI
jgi:uncharacterized protein (DUF433 family)